MVSNKNKRLTWMLSAVLSIALIFAFLSVVSPNGITHGDAYTKLLLHMNGTDGSHTFTDSSSNHYTVTAINQAAISTAQSKFGGASGYFPTTPNSGSLTVPDSDDWDFGSGDFTIDFWIYPTVIMDANSQMVRRGAPTGAPNGYNIYRPGSANALVFYASSDGTNWDIANNKLIGLVTLNSWQHFAVVRNGINFYTFKDGVQTNTWTSSGSIYKTPGYPLYLYRAGNYNACLRGYSDEMRISKGIARWTSNFTPPTSAYDNTAPVASNVSISGTPNVGQQLTGNYTYSDADSDLEGVSTFRWLRDGNPIVGETSLHYTTIASDAGKTIKFEVTPVALTGISPGTAVQSGGTVINSPPEAQSVNITGTPNINQTLTGHYTYFDADGDLQGTSTFRWLRNDNPIPGATNQTYMLTLSDVGTIIKFEVTPVAASGTFPGTVITSAGTAVLNLAPTATGVNVLDTPPVVGQQLTGVYTYSDAEGDLEDTSTFRWLRNDMAIGGATNSNYTLVPADAGTTIKFEVTPKALTGTSPGTPALSVGVSTLNTAPVASNVHITGTPNVGQTLTGNYDYSDPDLDPQGVSTFKWYRNGLAIDGASSLTYLLVSADADKTITFEVTPVALTGIPQGAHVQSAGFMIVNTVPSISIISVGENSNGNVEIDYSLSDEESDTCSLAAYEYSTDNFSWHAMAELTGAPDSGTMGLGALPDGVNHTFVWNTRTNLPDNYNETTYIRLRAFDSVDLGDYAVSSPFAIDTKKPVISNVTASQAQDGSGLVTIHYDLTDDAPLDLDFSVQMNISSDSGNNWNVNIGSAAGDIESGIPPGSKTITWNALSNFLNQELGTMEIRLIATDEFQNQSDYGYSSLFNVDTLNPTGLGNLVVTGTTSSSADLTWDTAVDTNFSNYKIWYGTSLANVQARTSSSSQITNINTTSTTIMGLSASTQYYFKIWATDSFGNEATTGYVFATTESGLPPPPTPPSPAYIPPPANPALPANVVTSAGGTIQSNGFTVTFPAGAVSSDTTINITSINSAPQAFDDEVFILGLTITATDYATNAPVRNLNQNVRITVHYTDSEISGVDESSLKIYYYDDVVKTYTPLPTTLDLANNNANAETNHFSTFVLWGTKISGSSAANGGTVPIAQPIGTTNQNPQTPSIPSIFNPTTTPATDQEKGEAEKAEEKTETVLPNITNKAGVLVQKIQNINIAQTLLFALLSLLILILGFAVYKLYILRTQFEKRKHWYKHYLELEIAKNRTLELEMDLMKHHSAGEILGESAGSLKHFLASKLLKTNKILKNIFLSGFDNINKTLKRWN